MDWSCASSTAPPSPGALRRSWQRPSLPPLPIATRPSSPVASTIIECHGEPFVRGSDGAAAIRQHDIRIRPSQPMPADANVVQGTVVRNVFLGATRDYIVAIHDGDQLRITAPPEGSFAPGTS